MRSAPDGRLVPALLFGTVVAAVPAILLLGFGRDPVELTGTVHCFAVGVTALAATAVGLAFTLAGAHSRDTGTVLVGTAFAVLASLLALHGLLRPGVLFGRNGVVSFTGHATLPAGGAILALSALALPPFLRGVKPLLGRKRSCS
jgi:hypothetical protein